MEEATSHGPVEVARLFVASAPIFMTLLDLDGRILEISPVLVKVFIERAGVTRDQLIGRPAAQAVPDAAADMEMMFARLAGGETSVAFERSLQPSEGRVVHLRCQADYWRDGEGRPVAVLLVHQDISAEIEAREARAESEAQLRAVVDNLPAQISLTDVESGRISLLNAKMSTGFAHYSGATVGARLQDLMEPAQLDELKRIIATLDAGGASEIERRVEGGVCDGRVMRMKHVIFNDMRGRRQLLWIAEDVTELRESAEALKRAAAEAEDANRAKSEFLANMSHEIRTPLNGVMGVAGALARTRLSGAQAEMVSLIETSAKTLETLLSDILDLARIEAGKMELRPEPFDLATSVGACGALFDAAAQAKGLDLEVSIAPDALGTYVGDAARLRQILSNLLGNAVKFTHVGGVRLTVAARRGETSSELRFEVRDTGIGFDAETKARLFSRFEQADGSITRRFGGSGLGLSISRSLAEAMGGRLEADAEPGEGAVFTLTLELPRGEGALDLWDEAAPPEPAADPLEGMRVLLAEDHPTNRRVVELILGAAGVDLTCVENGVEAVAAFRSRDFDLVLMDMQMPLLDGLAAVEEIRRLEALSGARPTPIHMLTANAMPEHVNASLAAGADGHLSKPILADALLERVGEAAAARLVAANSVQPARISSTLR
ncbi:MAG TPA: ATP-binding protein [Phenylobacterium sp.]|uniref:PAS domain-containing hybrid sensor histidine kinase/response regulator n=1 Tax=Phenylobacterium sp. TaxID=1871053 RepID=UPI002B4A9CDC|nr:ATP-binding protein [Phenylobacterium sp.]HKR88693.1 ATP-binding protein [Phenylobacterium sp.]